MILGIINGEFRRECSEKFHVLSIVNHENSFVILFWRFSSLFSISTNDLDFHSMFAVSFDSESPVSELVGLAADWTIKN